MNKKKIDGRNLEDTYLQRGFTERWKKSRRHIFTDRVHREEVSELWFESSTVYQFHPGKCPAPTAQGLFN